MADFPNHGSHSEIVHILSFGPNMTRWLLDEWQSPKAGDETHRFQNNPEFFQNTAYFDVKQCGSPYIVQVLVQSLICLTNFFFSTAMEN